MLMLLGSLVLMVIVVTIVPDILVQPEKSAVEVYVLPLGTVVIAGHVPAAGSGTSIGMSNFFLFFPLGLGMVIVTEPGLEEKVDPMTKCCTRLATAAC